MKPSWIQTFISKSTPIRYLSEESIEDMRWDLRWNKGMAEIIREAKENNSPHVSQTKIELLHRLMNRYAAFERELTTFERRRLRSFAKVYAEKLSRIFQELQKDREAMIQSVTLMDQKKYRNKAKLPQMAENHLSYFEEKYLDTKKAEKLSSHERAFCYVIEQAKQSLRMKEFELAICYLNEADCLEQKIHFHE